MNGIRVICAHCASAMQCPVSDAGKKVLCQNCFKSNTVPNMASSDDVEMENVSNEVTRAILHDDFEIEALKEAPGPSASLTTPAAAPVAPKDPDKALTNIAIGIFRLKMWPCQEEPGYKAFRAKVKFHSTQLETTSVDDYRVFAANGLLMMESQVIDLPQMQNVPVLETINEINLRSVSSVFIMNQHGVYMRHVLIPLTQEEGYLRSGMLLQTLRQMNHDRKHALSLIRQTVENKRVDPLAVAKAFANPSAPNTIPCHTMEETMDMASFAGFHAKPYAGQVALSREQLPAEKCSVRIAACPGFLRAWVALGEPSRGGSAWSFVPAAFRDFLKNFKTAKPHEILEHLNELNRNSDLVRFVYAKKQIVATAACFPADQAITVEQFKRYANALLSYAPGTSSASLAKAG